MKKLIFLTILCVSYHSFDSLLSMNGNPCDDYGFNDDIFRSFQMTISNENSQETNDAVSFQNTKANDINLSDLFLENNNHIDHEDYDLDNNLHKAINFPLQSVLGKRVHPDEDFDDYFLQSMPIAPIFQDESHSEIGYNNTGIINENGTDCFIISSLQVLKNIPKFLEILKMEASPARELNCFAEKLHGNTKPVPGIKMLRDTLVQSSSLQFMKCGQQDAQEFISGLLTTLEQDDENERVKNNFGIGIEYCSLCCSCGQAWNGGAQVDFLLPLHLSNYADSDAASVQDLINGELGSEEFLENGKCEQCEGLGILRSLVLDTLPNVLLISLKRFNHIEGKITRLNINVSPQEDLFVGNQNYKLCGVILHHHDVETSVNAGHYTAHVKNSDGIWHHYDDALCEQTTLEEVTKASSKPYVCLYRKI